MKRIMFLFFLGLILLLLPSCELISAPEPTPDRLMLIPPMNQKLTRDEDPSPPILHVEGWNEPVPAPGLLNTTGLEDSPFVTPDGNRMLFFFTPTIENSAEIQVLDGVTGLYFSDSEGYGWGAPQRVMLAEPGKHALDGCGTLFGDELWFCSVREGNLREIDIWTATRREGVWEVVNAGERLNLDLMVGEMHLSADGNLMLYHTNQLPGQGGLDIWQIRRKGVDWSEPENVDAVNTSGDEGWPFGSPSPSRRNASTSGGRATW
jgi:hypothetical protein